MALDINLIFTPATQPEWLQTLLQDARTLELPTTSWRPGDPERTILSILSYALNYTDAVASQMSMGGFLAYAATGTVSYSQPDGTTITVPVSPDPSTDANPNGLPTYLDALCEQNFNVRRIRLSRAGGALAILNTSVATYGPFAAGAYHVADAFTGAGYSNTVAVTIAPSTTAGTVLDVTDSSGIIRVQTSAAHGLTTGDAVWIADVGGVTAANGAWYVTVIDSDEFTLDGSTFAGAYTSGGTVYLPTVTTCTADEAGSTSSSYNGSGEIDTGTVTQAVTSLVGVSVSNLDVWIGTDTESNVQLAARAKLKLQSLSPNGPRGAYEFFALSAVEYAALLNPPETLSTPINRTLAVEDLTTGHVYVFLANASGAPSNDDVNVVQDVFAANCVPLGVTCESIAATEVNVSVAATIYLPAQYATDDNETLFATAIQAYFETFPIGGYTSSPDYTNVMPIADVIGVIYETARANNITVDNVSLTLNGSAANVSLPVSTSLASVAVLSPAVPSLTLTGT